MTSKPVPKDLSNALPVRLIELPMFLMLNLVREGYRHAVQSGIKFRMPDFAVLSVLAEFGPSDQRAIGERLNFDKSDVTKILNHLENEELVERKQDKIDGRRHQVALTTKGKKHFEAIRSELTSSMREFLSGLSEHEYEELGKLLLKSLAVHDERFKSMA